jgi:hypothetical protein
MGKVRRVKMGHKLNYAMSRKLSSSHKMKAKKLDWSVSFMGKTIHIIFQQISQMCDPFFFGHFVFHFTKWEKFAINFLSLVLPSLLCFKSVSIICFGAAD